MSVHTVPRFDPRGEHVRFGTECWCEPDVEWRNDETGEVFDEPLVKHNAPPGYDRANAHRDGWGVYES